MRTGMRPSVVCQYFVFSVFAVSLWNHVTQWRSWQAPIGRERTCAQTSNRFRTLSNDTHRASPPLDAHSKSTSIRISGTASRGGQREVNGLSHGDENGCRGQSGKRLEYLSSKTLMHFCMSSTWDAEAGRIAVLLQQNIVHRRIPEHFCVAVLPSG